MALHWHIDNCTVHEQRLHLRGWCFDRAGQIAELAAVFADSAATVPLTSFGQPSPDVAAVVAPAAIRSRFDEWVELPAGTSAACDFRLRVRRADGAVVVTEPCRGKTERDDPLPACWANFVRQLHALPGGCVLEIGSRARSAITRRDLVPRQLDYVGLDLLPGPNVDIVGDAHALEKLFGRRRFVAAFSFSVLEHVAMPWKFAIELNRVLAPGGIAFTQTHQTWPEHEAPCDFWRFSRFSWQTLFNGASGFKVDEAACGEPAEIHACRPNAVTRLLSHEPAYLGSASIVRKISETELSWPVPLHIAAPDMYPPGELSAPTV